MENIYYIIIVTAIIFEFLLSSLSSFLDIKNITSNIPKAFKKAYNQEKYVKSQEYLKAVEHNLAYLAICLALFLFYLLSIQIYLAY